MQTYKVTREFTDGALKGLTHTGLTAVNYPVGFHCAKPIGGAPYTITACERANTLSYACGCVFPTTEPTTIYDHSCADCHKWAWARRTASEYGNDEIRWPDGLQHY